MSQRIALFAERLLQPSSACWIVGLIAMPFGSHFAPTSNFFTITSFVGSNWKTAFWPELVR